MAITVTVDISLELAGDDLGTEKPNRVWLQFQGSPAQIWQYELQGQPPPPGGSARQAAGGDNIILVPGWLPTFPLQLSGASATFFWIDPQPEWGVNSTGSTFVLKGPTTDVGVNISSYVPSLIPIAQSNGGSYNPASGVWQPTPQTDFDFYSSQTIQLKVGWL